MTRFVTIRRFPPRPRALRRRGSGACDGIVTQNDDAISVAHIIMTQWTSEDERRTTNDERRWRRTVVRVRCGPFVSRRRGVSRGGIGATCDVLEVHPSSAHPHPRARTRTRTHAHKHVHVHARTCTHTLHAHAPNAHNKAHKQAHAGTSASRRSGVSAPPSPCGTTEMTRLSAMDVRRASDLAVCAAHSSCGAVVHHDYITMRVIGVVSGVRRGGRWCQSAWRPDGLVVCLRRDAATATSRSEA